MSPKNPPRSFARRFPRHHARSTALAALGLIVLFALGACAGLDFSPPHAIPPAPRIPPTSFAVFSDPHLFPAALGSSGTAFRAAADRDRKMFETSEAVLEQTVTEIRAARPSFVIVPGDLTKDGEEASHLAMARALSALRADGIPVYVVPGNHDVNNPGAVRFDGDRAIPVPTVSPDRFAEIYSDFGYGQAIARDPSSLAYVASPRPGLWILAMDACAWQLSAKEKREHTAGFFPPERLDWIRGMLERARAEGVAVIGVMHHGVVEHFPGQAAHFSDYLVADYGPFGRMLASYGVRVVFTGHFHAQNIAGAWWALDGATSGPPTNRFLFDVETGSLSTWPCPWRLVTVDDAGTMRIRSSRIATIAGMGADFAAYALAQDTRGTFPVIAGMLERFGIGRAEAERIALPLTRAASAHSAGDPDPRQEMKLPDSGLSLIGSIAVGFAQETVHGMWTGVAPHADNDIDIDLVDGTYREVR